MENNLFLGLDIQIKRDCAFYALDSSLHYITSGWLGGASRQEIAQSLVDLVRDLEDSMGSGVAVGIDAPRMGLQTPREYYWKGDGWRGKNSQDKGYGRHCEVVIKALSIANPQWTRFDADAPPWMKLGFDLFRSLKEYPCVYEVFPSASYAMLKDLSHRSVSLSFQDFHQGPKDMLDACIAAFTVSEFMQGRGCEVGGGDNLGTIILPGELPVPASHPVLSWPT